MVSSCTCEGVPWELETLECQGQCWACPNARYPRASTILVLGEVLRVFPGGDLEEEGCKVPSELAGTDLGCNVPDSGQHLSIPMCAPLCCVSEQPMMPCGLRFSP